MTDSKFNHIPGGPVQAPTAHRDSAPCQKSKVTNELSKDRRMRFGGLQPGSRKDQATSLNHRSLGTGQNDATNHDSEQWGNTTKFNEDLRRRFGDSRAVAADDQST